MVKRNVVEQLMLRVIELKIKEVNTFYIVFKNIT